MRTAVAAVLVLPLLVAAAPPAPGIIAAAQRELRSHGYDVGPVNGVMTDKTQRAIEAYLRTGGGQSAPAVAAAGAAVAEAQRALAGLGLLPAPADGVVGPATRDAIIRFEVAHGLPVDPRVSDRLLAALAPTAAPAPAPPVVPGRQALPPGVTPPPIR